MEITRRNTIADIAPTSIFTEKKNQAKINKSFTARTQINNKLA